MSAAEEFIVGCDPPVWVPNPDLTEPERAHLEDPDFAVIEAKARAMARGETYQPERHGPFAVSIVPRMARIAEMKPMIDVEALLARFNARGAAPGQHLRAEPGVRDFKRAQSGDR